MKNEFGKFKLTLSDLVKWLLDHEAISEDEHSPFVLSYQYSEYEELSFRFIVTTKTLLGLALNTDILHCAFCIQFYLSGISCPYDRYIGSRQALSPPGNCGIYQ